MQFVKGLFIGLRPANLPSLLSNALLAWVCVRESAVGVSWSFGLVLIAGLGFYAYGMWANDAHDLEWDMEHSPMRPIPQGLISQRAVKNASLIGLWASLVLGFYLGAFMWGCALVLSILTYTQLHKKTIFAVFLMGACRGLWLCFAGYSLRGAIGSVGVPWLLFFAALSLACFTVLISVLAREESLHYGRKQLVCLLLSLMPLHDALWVFCLGAWDIGLACLSCMALGMYMQRKGQRAS